MDVTVYSVLDRANKKLKRPVLVLAFFCFYTTISLGQFQPKLILIEDTTSLNVGCLKLQGLDQGVLDQLLDNNPTTAQWRNILGVFPTAPLNPSSKKLPPMLGKYWVGNNSILFKPRFPFIAGRKYSIRYIPLNSDLIFNDTFHIPEAIQYSTEVQHIYPSTNRIPQNLLKIYIHFFRPMGNTSAYAHIQLLNSDGKEVSEPFLTLEPELWDRERKRFTLWFNPGRIKRDLIPNLQKGLPLKADEHYKLVIKRSWKDANGQPLKQDFIKEFDVAKADRFKPNSEDWQVEEPPLGTTSALSIHFNEPMDHAVMESVIAVFDMEGRLISGEVDISSNERVWSFSPTDPWQHYQYILRISSDLEDMAGNNLQRLFDTDINAVNRSQKVGDYIEIPFQPKQKN